jgi:glycosyltransferase involved in cell wall biosynthesis
MEYKTTHRIAFAKSESAGLVSVVIPAHHSERFIGETLASIGQQEFGRWEVIVVEDGSRDRTEKIVRSFARRHPWHRVEFSRNERNVGPAQTRNVAFAKCRGEFIALLDSDDLYLPFALELMHGLLGRFPQAGFAYTDFMILREGRPPSGSGLRLWHGPAHRWDAVFDKRYRFRELKLPLPAAIAEEDFDVYSGDIYGDSLRGPQVLPSASLFRRKLMGELRFPESDSICGDWEFFARLSKRHGAVYADVPGTLNRSHEDEVRLTRTLPAIQLEKRISMIDRLWRQDPEFMAQHGSSVDLRQFDLLLGLARNRLLAGDVARARAALACAAPIRSDRRTLQWFALRVVAYLPGATLLLRAARAARHGAWRVLHGQSP